MIDVELQTDELLDDGIAIRESGIELNLRKLNTGDIFRAARMVKRLGIKEDLKKLLSKFSNSDSSELPQDSSIHVVRADYEKKEKNKMEIGIDFIFSLLEILTNEKAEHELYQFISGPLGITDQQVEELEIESLADALLKIADIEYWKYFLSRAAR